eukprot:5026010-Ditylum_brightwellii.AAC.1
MKSITGKVEEASIKYELAISANERNEFIHEQAIANKQAAEFLLQNGESSKAAYCYGKAHIIPNMNQTSSDFH